MRYCFIIAVSFISFFNVNAQTDVVTGIDSAFKNAGEPEVIYYSSDTVKLKGYLEKPQGKGSFPVYMWNHDSEKDPVFNIALAQFWVKHGYVFFMPVRCGFGDNPGIYICNKEKQINRMRIMAQLAFRQIYALHKKDNQDVIAALKWIKKQPYTDTNNIVVAGGGYGAIQALITAEKDGQAALGVKCFVAFWASSTVWYNMWGDSLSQAINMANRPIFFIQAQSEGNQKPAQTLGPILEKKGYPNESKIFQDHSVPPESIEPAHFYTFPNLYGKDVLKYLKDCGVKGRKG